MSEALTTEDGLLRERSGVQCEAQASLSALRGELPPVLAAALELWLLLQLNTLLRVRSLPVRMHSGPSDQGYNWVVACHRAGHAMIYILNQRLSVPCPPPVFGPEP